MVAARQTQGWALLRPSEESSTQPAPPQTPHVPASTVSPTLSPRPSSVRRKPGLDRDPAAARALEVLLELFEARLPARLRFPAVARVLRAFVRNVLRHGDEALAALAFLDGQLQADPRERLAG